MEQGVWSVLWARLVWTWADHIVRNREGGCWTSRIRLVRPSFELDSLRSLNDGRPATRFQSGFCPRRWNDSVRMAFSFLEQRDSVPHKLGADFKERVLFAL